MRTALLRVSLLSCLCAAILCAQSSDPQTAARHLTIGGDLPATLVLTPRPRKNAPRNHVRTRSRRHQVEYEGVLLREILKRAGAPMDKQLRGKALASYVLAKAHDGYEVVFTLGEIAPEFGNAAILVADKRDGKPLFGYQGPLRLVCPNDKAGARSVRMLETLELVKLQK